MATNSTVTTVETSPPMTGIWRTLRDYILWSYERGTIQYDVMVTLILFFIFLSPYWINFKDKPLQRNPHSPAVIVLADGTGGLIFEIDGSALQDQDSDHVKAELSRIVEPISGKVTITKYERSPAGPGVNYKVWARRE